VELDFDGSPSGENRESRFAARVRFRLEAARPIARIPERGGVEVLVSRSRRRVPLDRVAPGASRLPRIEGLPGEGSIDREPTLDDALALVAALDARGLPERMGLETVRLDAKRCVSLECGSGARVEWGKLASSPTLKTEDRVQRLEGFLTKGPALAQVERLAVEWDDPVYVLKPIQQAAVASADARPHPD
jgi:hypothetical protein